MILDGTPIKRIKRSKKSTENFVGGRGMQISHELGNFSALQEASGR